MASIEESVEYTYSADTKDLVVNVDKADASQKKATKSSEELEKAQKKLSDAENKSAKATRELEIANNKLNEANQKVSDAQNDVAVSTARLDELNADTTTSTEELAKAQKDLSLSTERLAKAENDQLKAKNNFINTNDRLIESNRKVEDSQKSVEEATKKTNSSFKILGDTSEKVFGKMGAKAPSVSATIVTAITAIATASYAVVEAMYAMQNSVEIAIAGIQATILGAAGMITTALDDIASALIGLGIDPAKIEENASAIISLGIAASATGASMEGLAKANVAYYKAILAAEDPTDGMILAVNTLGISAYNADGSIKSLAQIIVELEQVINSSGYSATLVAAIYKIFGASASNLFQIIAYGTENFKQLAQKIADTITKDVITELQTFHQQVSIMTVKAQVAVILFASWAATMAETWIPKIQAAIQTMRDAIARTKEWWNESSILVPILEALWQTMVLLHDIISPVINLIQEVIRWFDDWWDETSKINKVLQAMYDIISSITGAIDNLIDKVFDLINAFQDFRAENFGSDLVNLGASSANAANQQAMFSTIPNFISGQGNVTNSTTNTFHISPRQTMSYRDAYRQGQLATARGGL